MKAFFKIIFILIFTFSPIGISGQSINKLNKKGLSHLLRNDYDSAIQYFSKVLIKSPDNPFANYNLACAYGLKIQQDYCLIVEYETKMIEHLKTAIKGNRGYSKKILSDPDLKPIYPRYEFQKLGGYSQKAILTRITWFGHSPGAYGPLDQFEFDRKLRFTYKKMNLNELGEIERKIWKGKYKWSKDHLILEFYKTPLHKSKKKIFKAKLKDNKLEIEGFDYIYSDNNDPCSA
jgi:tetratricopeptide (TPR) repeat protein